MGMYVNPGSRAFEKAVNSEIYVDKTGLIEYLNSVVNTEQSFICISRPRRFGKTMGMNMLAAYYDCTVDAASVFNGLSIIADRKTFDAHANKYIVIKLEMTKLSQGLTTIGELIAHIKTVITRDLFRIYPRLDYLDKDSLQDTMYDVYSQTGKQFVILIDEWDSVIRERQHDTEGHKQYLDFLRYWLKNQDYVALAYMTGILPVKKYGKHSALNMFREFSMEDPWKLAEYVGFTSDEVLELCERYDMDYQNCKAWYNGYSFPYAKEIYSPWSVVEACKRGRMGNYWNKTETYEALKVYISMNFEGLKEIVLRLMAGEHQQIETGSFVNDMTTFACVDDVLTLLVHLGYLAYDIEKKEVFIPNNEIRQEFANSVQTMEDMTVVAKAIRASEMLLEATLNGEATAVATAIEAAHLETCHLQYNDENALSYTVGLAYYTAKRKYTVVRELPAGKGFADLAFIPRPNHADLPPMIIELKWDNTAETAIAQIKNKKYAGALQGYGKVLLVGISYDKKTREHRCVIEETVL